MSGQSKTVELILTLLYYLSKDDNTCLRNKFQVLQQSSLTKHKLTGNNNASYFKIYASHMTIHLDSVEANCVATAQIITHNLNGPNLVYF